MMRKFLLFVSVVALTINVAYPQSKGGDSARQVKSSELVPIGETFFVKAARTTRVFEGVKVKSEPVVVALDMDAGKKGATLYYKLTADPGSSEIYLLSGA